MSQSTTGLSGLHLLARALLLGVGPEGAARALSAEFGWDVAVSTLADLTHPDACAALWAAVAAQQDLPDSQAASELPVA